MDPSSGQHQEIMSSHSMENMLVCSKAGQERKPRPQPDEALKCPRCDSTNTKFCYYNNYSLTQPRYFCKSCRRYWTKGGTLRNVPVGGGCRKNNKKSISSSSSSSSSAIKRAQDQPLTPLPTLVYDSNDLTLAFARLQRQTSGQMGYDHHGHDHLTSAPPSFLDALRSGFLDTQNTNFVCYDGYGNGHMGGGGGGEMENTSSGEMVTYEDVTNNTQALTMAPMKQELGNGNGRVENENRILWGFPWQQMNGNGSINIMGGGGGGAGINGGGEFESSSSEATRESWINGLGTNWHGLLNSALM